MGQRMGTVRRRTGAALGVAAVAALALVAAGCSGSSGSEGGRTSTTAATTTTTVPLTWTAATSGEHRVDGNYRQGVARAGGGWYFTTNDAIYRTDDAFKVVRKLAPAIPPGLADQGYDHMGDPDVAGGLLWIPLEKPYKGAPGMVTARFDAKTLTFVDAIVVPQHHNAFVTVDRGVAYSADQFTDDAIVRYRVKGTVAVPLPPLKLTRKVARIQGADVADGALWLSTDDGGNRIYRVDLVTGAVQAVGTMGHGSGEGEGIDATDLPSGLLHALVADPAIVPMWLVDLGVVSKPA